MLYVYYNIHYIILKIIVSSQYKYLNLMNNIPIKGLLAIHYKRVVRF